MAYAIAFTKEIKAELVEKGYIKYPWKTLLGIGEPLYMVPFCNYTNNTYSYHVLPNGTINGSCVKSEKELILYMNDIKNTNQRIQVWDVKPNLYRSVDFYADIL